MKVNFIKQLTDAGRLISDGSHSISINRKGYIAPALTITMRAMGEKTEIDGWLDGSELSKKIDKIQKIKIAKINYYVPGSSDSASYSD